MWNIWANTASPLASVIRKRFAHCNITLCQHCNGLIWDVCKGLALCPDSLLLLWRNSLFWPFNGFPKHLSRLHSIDHNPLPSVLSVIWLLLSPNDLPARDRITHTGDIRLHFCGVGGCGDVSSHLIYVTGLRPTLKWRRQTRQNTATDYSEGSKIAHKRRCVWLILFSALCKHSFWGFWQFSVWFFFFYFIFFINQYLSGSVMSLIVFFASVAV